MKAFTVEVVFPAGDDYEETSLLAVCASEERAVRFASTWVGERDDSEWAHGPIKRLHPEDPLLDLPAEAIMVSPDGNGIGWSDRYGRWIRILEVEVLQ